MSTLLTGLDKISIQLSPKVSKTRALPAATNELVHWGAGEPCDTQAASFRYKTALGFPSRAEILRDVLCSCTGTQCDS